MDLLGIRQKLAASYNNTSAPFEYKDHLTRLSVPLFPIVVLVVIAIVLVIVKVIIIVIVIAALEVEVLVIIAEWSLQHILYTIYVIT